MCVKNRTRSKAFKWRSDGVQMAFRNRSGLRKNCVKPWCLEDVFFLTHLRSQDRNGGVQQQLEEWTIQLNCPRPAHHGKRLVGRPIGTQTIHKIGDPTKKNEFIDKGFITFHYSGNHLWGLVDSP